MCTPSISSLLSVSRASFLINFLVKISPNIFLRDAFPATVASPPAATTAGDIVAKVAPTNQPAKDSIP